MNLVAVETRTALRRLGRRRTTLVVVALALLLAFCNSVVDPVETARAALSEAGALAALTVLVLAAGIVADDRATGRLALAATHPSRRAAWVVGRWLAVFGVAVAVLSVAAAVLLAAAPVPVAPARALLGWAAGVAYAAALAALAVSLSCQVGSTPQILVLVSLLVVGAMPPDVVTHALGPAWAALARTFWTVLPTPWVLGRLLAWAFAADAPSPLLALALPAQAAVWLWAGARVLERAELGARSP